jgi:hypothetical protein
VLAAGGNVPVGRGRIFRDLICAPKLKIGRSHLGLPVIFHPKGVVKTVNSGPDSYTPFPGDGGYS